MILFIGHSGEIGGAELNQLDIARHFRKESRVLLLADGPFRELLEANDIDVMVLPGGDALHRVRRESGVPGPRSIVRVLNLARRVAAIGRHYDLLYANTQKAFVVACAASPLCGRPVLWHLHDILTPEHFSRTNIRLDVALANHVAKRVVAVSRATRDSFIAHGGRPDRIRVVYNGINDGPFTRVTAAHVAEVRARLGLQDQAVVGGFSRLAEWKGQHHLIEAMADIPGAHLLLAGGALFGTTDYESRLHALVQSHGMTDRVHFLGMRDDVPALMGACDIVVHSSVAAEPFARVVIESMLSARPLVAARGGGVVEIVDDGRTGILFEPGNVRSLHAAIAGLLADPDRAGSIARQAQLHAIRNFRVESMLRGIEAQVREVQAA